MRLVGRQRQQCRAVDIRERQQSQTCLCSLPYSVRLKPSELYTVDETILACRNLGGRPEISLPVGQHSVVREISNMPDPKVAGRRAPGKLIETDN